MDQVQRRARVGRSERSVRPRRFQFCRRRVDPRLALRAVLWLVTIVVAGATVRALFYSLRWPLLEDTPLMHYIALGMLHGAVPYRDVRDMNMPGIYWIHEAVIGAFGTGDMAWRIFDLACLAAICLAAAGILRRAGAEACALGIALLAAWHLDAGPMNAGQRDFIVVLPLMVAASRCVRFAETRRRLDLAVAGFGIGLGILIKPTCVLVPALLIPALFASGRRDLGEIASDALWIAIPIVAVLAAATAMLASEGAIGPFIDGWRGFILPVYSKLKDSSPTLMESASRIGVRLLPCMLLVAASWAFGANSGSRHVHFVLGAFAAWGFLSFLLQDKGWFYHSYPWAMFTTVWGVSAAGDLLASESVTAQYAAMVVACSLPLMVMHGGRLVGPPGSDQQVVPFARFIARDLSRLIGPGDLVQTMDTTDGAIHALLLLNVRQPTPFIYDWMLLAGGDTPFRRAARAEFMAKMTAAPPKAIVITNQQWPEPSHGYTRVGSWKEFNDFLLRSYTLRSVMRETPKRKSSRGYLIYVRNG